MRVTGLQRVGIVLSVAWAVGAGNYTRNADVQRAEDFAKWSYKVCTDSKTLRQDTDLSSCDVERRGDIATFMEGSDRNVLFAAVAPIPVAWLAVFILLYAWRVQVAGARAVLPWATLSAPKKSFTIFCGVSGAVAIGLALMSVLNLYVDTQVPVALPPRATMVKLPGGDRVQVHGTWIRSGITEGSGLGIPLQTSVIDCNRAERRCTEARASVSGNLLMSEIVDYDIQTWTDNAIVLKQSAFCAEEVFTIDLNTETVSGAGHWTNMDNALCKSNSAGREKWSYRLADGFPVYWELRQKARPLPLRLVQALFDH